MFDVSYIIRSLTLSAKELQQTYQLGLLV